MILKVLSLRWFIAFIFITAIDVRLCSVVNSGIIQKWKDARMELREPLILQQVGEFYEQADPIERLSKSTKPTDDYEYEGNLKMFCPDDVKNAKFTPWSHSSLIKKADVEGTQGSILASNYLCEKPLIPEIIREIEPSNGCQKYSVGFQIYSKEPLNIVQQLQDLPQNFHWISYFNYCYDRTLMNAVYATELVQNFEIIPNDESKIITINEYTWPDNFALEYNIETFYELKRQETVFQKFFPKTYKKYYDLDQGKYLVKQELIDQRNHQMAKWKIGTLSYLNIAPMFKVIQQNAWDYLEKFIRKKLRYVEPITTMILTGTYGTLTLEGKDISLSIRTKDYIKVPQFFYKIVTVNILTTTRSMFIITYNNPFSPPDSNDEFCDKRLMCDDYGWKITYENHELGYTYCCEPTAELLQKLNVDFTIGPVMNLDNLAKIMRIQRKILRGRATEKDMQMLETL